MQRPLQGLRHASVFRESLAGLTLLAIAVPLNIGYAQIAGLPVTAGLYALIVPALVYVILVSSRQVVASPDAAAAALVFSSLVGLGVGEDDFAEMAAAQAILCGLALLIAAVLRWGFLANFLSHPILIGFVAGLALEVLVSQVRKMLGVASGHADGFFREVVELITRIPEASAPSVLLSVCALVILVGGRRLLPKAPWALLVLILATFITAGFHLDQVGVAVLGEVEAGPPQFAFPTLSFSQWASLIPSALALALITMAEGVLLSRSYGEQRGYRTDSDQDLLAFGAANVAAGLSMSFAVGSSTSRTAATDQLGSRTQLPSLIMAAGAVLLLLFGTDVLAQIPTPVIGAVVAVAVFNLLGMRDFIQLARTSPYEFGIGAVCLLGVLILGPLQGLAIAFILSLVNLARRAATPQVDALASGDADAFTEIIETPEPGELLVIRLAGQVFFANAPAISEQVTALVDAAGPETTGLVLDAEGISDVDATGAGDLRRLLDALEGRGIRVVFARVRPRLRERLETFGLLEGIGQFTTNRDAVKALAGPSSSKSSSEPRRGGHA
ncbi:sulfate permease [Microbacterium sp. Root1433D1]|uniref:SulP family inorganic anion transporter n=1 Tax=Microbacterium sp. Root1433D1 TaxID=1736463 RepID=UPI0006F8A33D|nr:SulP family inorganic anion transporter [Microbacterium sp. Root1433D1]KQY75853.1 sulfate permease [Microbacterium sp. Root1433D1]